MRPESIDPQTLEQRDIGPLTVLFGFENGKYPYGNSLLVRGEKRQAMIDPGLGMVARRSVLPEASMVMHSHTHEDHIAGTHLYPDSTWLAHEADALGLESMEGLMKIYGIEPGEKYTRFSEEIRDDFYYPQAQAVETFVDGALFDFGGVSLTVIHTPGHTRGHCCFLLSWGPSADERLVYLGDIELTGFGPYYGDAWSDLTDFENSLDKLREIDARWWLTFHHKGLIDGRDRFLGMLDKFAGMIDDRESRLLEFLKQPRTLEDIVAHRFIYRPGQTGFLIDQIEARSMQMHLDRLLAQEVIRHQGHHYQVIV